MKERVEIEGSRGRDKFMAFVAFNGIYMVELPGMHARSFKL